MRILVIGGGGREHAIAWRLDKSQHEVFCVPGNPGIATVATCLDGAVALTDAEALLSICREHSIELVVIGPEAPLVAGVADALRRAGVAVFGPGRDGAQLEGSKIFAKEFFAKHGIPTSPFRCCGDVEEADAAIDSLVGEFSCDVVVKADGLAAGKGVVVCDSADQAKAAARAMLTDGAFGVAGSRVVIERRIRGRELSVLALTDGKRCEYLELAEDHKAVFDGDTGPNTGGMGTVSPLTWVGDDLLAQIKTDIFDRTLAGLRADGIEYRGVLYAGIIVEDGKPWLLEYNCRFGDPETQSVLMRLDDDLGVWLAAAAQGALPPRSLSWREESAACVVLAASGYPAKPRKGDVITGLDAFVGLDDTVVFHAGTAQAPDAYVTAGGRVLGVTALGANVTDARANAYEAVTKIHFEGMHFRKDIGGRGGVPK